jgi:hypothetical protein
MKIHALSIGVLAAALTAAALLSAKQKPSSPPSDQAQTQTFTGIISDYMCGGKHDEGDSSDAECTRSCVGMGSNYALVVGNKVYTLSGNRSALKALAGQKAIVTGTLKGDHIQVSSAVAGK